MYHDRFHPDKDFQYTKLFARIYDKNVKLNNEVQDYIENQQQGIKTEKKNVTIKKWRKVMISCALHFQKLNMDLREVKLI
jgi:hypothetical protein